MPSVIRRYSRAPRADNAGSSWASKRVKCTRAGRVAPRSWHAATASDFSSPQDLDRKQVVEFVGPERHPLRLGVPGEVVLAEIRPVVWEPILTIDHHHATTISLLPERRRSRISGRNSAHDDDDPPVGRIVRDLGG